MTDEERRLWYRLRKQQVDGCRFRRQVPVGPYFADFLSFDRGIVIELDGGQHTVRREYDRRRTAFLEAKGFRVLRFWNFQVNEDLEAVLDAIATAVVERWSLVFDPPPPPGEGRGGGGQ